MLSLLTKIASGYWHVADSQAGYTAISLRDARAARPRPHLPRLRVPERHARAPERVERARARLSRRGPVYGVGERSGIKLRSVVPRISWLLLKGFLWRLREKYVIRDFHPLVFFYVFGFVMTTAGLALGIVETVLRSRATPSRSAPSCSSHCCSSRARSSRSSRCGSTWRRTRTCANSRGVRTS